MGNLQDCCPCLQDEVKILRRIGEGAFGEVSLATCAIFGSVAVKWLKVSLTIMVHALILYTTADVKRAHLKSKREQSKLRSLTCQKSAFETPDKNRKAFLVLKASLKAPAKLTCHRL